MYRQVRHACSVMALIGVLALPGIALADFRGLDILSGQSNSIPYGVADAGLAVNEIDRKVFVNGGLGKTISAEVVGLEARSAAPDEAEQKRRWQNFQLLQHSTLPASAFASGKRLHSAGRMHHGFGPLRR